MTLRPILIARILTLAALLAGAHLWAQDEPDSKIVAIIKKHGLEQSQVMDIASWLTDVYGPRLTGSPMLDTATQWAMAKLESWGMKNVHLEAWGPFGRGWQLDHFEMHVETPTYFPILGYPKAWSGATVGSVSGPAIYLDANDQESLRQYEGRLRGKFVLLDTTRNVREWFDPSASRLDDNALLSLANKGQPTPRGRRNFRRSGARFSSMLWNFLQEEKPAAVLDRSYKGDLGTVFVSEARVARGRARDEGTDVIPQVTVSIEHYNRIFRLLQKDIPVTLNLDLQSTYTNPDGMEHNIIAEIEGGDLAHEVVIFGAHFDSWHSATGATDNAAGSAVMMEAARILLETFEETGVKPRRTLRLALWTGEEQGLYGSEAYVRQHYGESDLKQGKKDEREIVSAYYNLDNGTGKIRGVHLQGNAAVGPIFRQWLEPFGEMGASTLTLGNTGGTDHLSFDAIGIPGFQFIQDPISYSTKTHHSNMDHWDHLIEEDLKQAATIIASFVYHTAQRDDRLPRKFK